MPNCADRDVVFEGCLALYFKLTEREWDQRGPKPRESLRIMPTTRHCLLVVDDEPNVCESVHDLLRREFRVLKAHSADEGYRLMLEEEVHIVMSDQRMPQISGVELLTKVKARHPQAIRMLFTGFADLESVIAAINQGHIYQFMKKPWQPEELLTAVRQAALEYDRLELVALERENLQEEVMELKQRVSNLESEVRCLQTRSAQPEGWHAPAAEADRQS
jgi:response regulator RpfG family c-di-GMP phosphodiesterase